HLSNTIIANPQDNVQHCFATKFSSHYSQTLLSLIMQIGASTMEIFTHLIIRVPMYDIRLL
ncbi:MAG: hypothetical protein KBA53_08150, partial [Thermoclostridium sp.]|nr:hypothetical protein [Thermoclostridium sp.]